MSTNQAHRIRETEFAGSVTGRYWHRIDDGRLQCDVCPRYCKLREGQRGLCFVRARHNDEIVLTTYGRSSGFCIDPIEKKPLDHFLPGTPVLSFGTLTCTKKFSSATRSSTGAPNRCSRSTGCSAIARQWAEAVAGSKRRWDSR